MIKKPKLLLFLLLLSMFYCLICNAQTRMTSKITKRLAQKTFVDESSTLVCWKGSTPTFDGVVGNDEYSDASSFEYNENDYYEWIGDSIESPQDLYFKGWIKHDGEYLYMAFDVVDDVFYGIETTRWTPVQDPMTHVIGQREQGRPWFGDMIEVLFYGRLMEMQQAVKKKSQTGDGRNMQIVYNLTKSYQGGIGVAGFLPHGPKLSQENWDNSIRWISDGIVDSRTAIYPEQNRYTVELRFRLNGAIEIRKDKYWSMNEPDISIGFNFTVGDVDLPSQSPTGRLHHEVWWAPKFPLSEEISKHKGWGILVLTAKEKPKEN